MAFHMSDLTIMGCPSPMWPWSVAAGRRSYAVVIPPDYRGPGGSVDKQSGNPDHMGMTDHTLPALPDYHLADELEVESSAALKALADPTRSTIITLLEERAASINQLAKALSKPKGSVGHHVKALESAGLIRVVRTRQVRAITEKFYGRTARWFLLTGLKDSEWSRDFAVQQALGSAVSSDDLPATVTARYARIPADRANEYIAELIALVDRFKAESPAGDTVYAMVAGVFPTDQPFIAPDESSP